ncbi:bifunctional D-cysteine desulfhydrase/1-aminocyclopropane-1-carboxylate deaminase, mitochondrial-like isoform X2 [Euphorbia lathyris]|uniref:bifunctional D-cysteine desulfhydrase/1-aminocyclopropane-1-carboxylate deaminase, mitochondrial-like isoform X2 n=1 Tax=Euphorbia lathyris TaxID=212925 RepID=UPI00331314BF
MHSLFCGDSDYFHSVIQGLTDGRAAILNSHDFVNIQNAKGLGYAMNTSHELQFVKEVAISTGVVLDPVYSGKSCIWNEERHD